MPTEKSTSWIASLKALRYREEGTTAIEFGLLAMPLFYLMFGIMEFGIAMMFQGMLEGATIDTSRLGKTGYSGTNMSREQTLRAEVKARTHNMLDVTKIVINSKSYTNFTNIKKPEPWTDTNRNGRPDPGEYTDINGNGKWDSDMGKAGYGGARDIVIYTVTYPWQVMTPVISQFFTNGTWPLSAVAVVKNEPY